jgi:hypothetical protein
MISPSLVSPSSHKPFSVFGYIVIDATSGQNITRLHKDTIIVLSRQAKLSVQAITIPNPTGSACSLFGTTEFRFGW